MRNPIREYLLAHSAAPRPHSLSDEESLLDAGVIDSAAMIGLIAFLEGQYGVSVSDDDMTPENFDSVNAVVAYVQSKMAAES